LNPLPSLADADLLGVFSGGADASKYRHASLLKVAFAAKKDDNEEEAFKKRHAMIYDRNLRSAQCMNALIVYAHPDPHSFNAAMRDVAVDVLTEAGDSVQVSDLYALHFKAVLDEHDFKERQNPDVFNRSPNSTT